MEGMRAAHEEIQKLEKQFNDLHKENKHEEADKLRRQMDDKVLAVTFYYLLCACFSNSAMNVNAYCTYTLYSIVATYSSYRYHCFLSMYLYLCCR
jgi:hypothetical protein